jgi:hypothetical protein
MARSKSFTQILALIGGLIIFIDGILSLIRVLTGWYIPGLPGWGFIPAIAGLAWINPIIVLVIGILALISVDVFSGGIPYNGIWLLILGIAGLIFGSYFLGGILLIIASVLWFVGKR